MHTQNKIVHAAHLNGAGLAPGSVLDHVRHEAALLVLLQQLDLDQRPQCLRFDRRQEQATRENIT